MKKIVMMLIIGTISIMASNDAEIEQKIKDCDAGNYNSCNFVADTFLFQEKQMSANFMYSKAKDIMIKECNNDDYTACYNLGFNFELGSPAYPKDEKLAMKYYKKQLDHNKKVCETGNMTACFNLGLDYSDKGILKNDEKAKKYFGISCSNGNETACNKLK